MRLTAFSVLLSAPSCAALRAAPLRHTVMARAAPMKPSMVALEPLVGDSRSDEELKAELSLPMLSGMRGKAMFVEQSDVPSKIDVRNALPPHVFKKITWKSMMYAAISVLQSAACLGAGMLIPLNAAWLPAWIAYAAISGTVWTGMWVVAHECGHGAFSDNRALQDTVGYILHTFLLVPYFSWQRSHAVHHTQTNHITEGETHVPIVVNGRPGVENPGGEGELANAKRFGKTPWGLLQLVLHLVIGWPAYLLWGATGGPKYGTSNHFVPVKPFDTALWPASWPSKVWRSDIGIG